MWQVTYTNLDKRPPYTRRSLQACIDEAFYRADLTTGMGGHDGIFMSKLDNVSEYEVNVYCVGYGHKTTARIKKLPCKKELH